MKKLQCNWRKMKIIRLNNFLFILNLRQGAILIAVHQIALSSFVLIILLVGISHVGEMLTLLHNDMEDEAERRGFFEVKYGGGHLLFHESDLPTSNNQKRFVKAQHLASATVILLYTSTALTAAYLACCIMLLHGAVRCRRAFLLPWIAAACIALLLLLVALALADTYPCLVNLFGGHNLYHFGCAIFVLTFVYAISAVTSFALETSAVAAARGASCAENNDERGERLLLLDHAAHSSLLSAAQLKRMSSCTRTQFV
ncbi:hypothetical protein EVAR_75009_1 [Eumeta japonica]|uniref:Uncharacterized protein n=1 Tax=Eumeta variegata TaxID=151549 RepID=A0A4C1VCL5_EUMVA|nr:hypothetical protein EVAR_75009_1 [Eumeta japonica]